MTLLKKLGYLSSERTVFLLCDVQDKFSFMNYFADFLKNVNKVVSCDSDICEELINVN